MLTVKVDMRDLVRVAAELVPTAGESEPILSPAEMSGRVGDITTARFRCLR
jgi:hypothetical protein